MPQHEVEGEGVRGEEEDRRRRRMRRGKRIKKETKDEESPLSRAEAQVP